MRVLISGAGIAGPALAWHLSRLSAQVTVVEKAPSLLAIGQNIDVHGSALMLMRRMGLFDELMRWNTTEQGTHWIKRSNGKPFATFPVGGPGMTSQFEILRGDLARVLYEATLNDANVTYEFGKTVKTVLENGTDVVKVEMNDEQVREYDMLVLADGQWSRLRKQCFPPEAVQAIDKNMYAAYWTIEPTSSDNDWWNIYVANKRRLLTIRPDPHGTKRAMFTFMPQSKSEKSEWEKASKSGDINVQRALLQRHFSDAGWLAKRFLDSLVGGSAGEIGDKVRTPSESPSDFYFQSIQQIRMTHWHTGRVICLGDAAYAPTPLTGMGASLAILGAYVLAGELSKNIGHPSKAFTSYESIFRPFVEEVQNVPSFVPGIMHPKGNVQRAFLFSLIWLASKVAKLPYLVRLHRQHEEAEDFPLPYYAAFPDPNAAPSKTANSPNTKPSK